jgi:hypothetical protein
MPAGAAGPGDSRDASDHATHWQAGRVGARVAAKAVAAGPRAGPRPSPSHPVRRRGTGDAAGRLHLQWGSVPWDRTNPPGGRVLRTRNSCPLRLPAPSSAGNIRVRLGGAPGRLGFSTESLRPLSLSGNLAQPARLRPPGAICSAMDPHAPPFMSCARAHSGSGWQRAGETLSRREQDPGRRPGPRSWTRRSRRLTGY